MNQFDPKFKVSPEQKKDMNLRDVILIKQNKESFIRDPSPPVGVVGPEFSKKNTNDMTDVILIWKSKEIRILNPSFDGKYISVSDSLKTKNLKQIVVIVFRITKSSLKIRHTLTLPRSKK